MGYRYDSFSISVKQNGAYQAICVKPLPMRIVVMQVYWGLFIQIVQHSIQTGTVYWFSVVELTLHSLDKYRSYPN